MLDTKFLLFSNAVALAALVVSCIALWRTHFARPAPIIAVGNLRHRVYPIRSDKSRWFITSFDLPITISNHGAQPLLVTALRLSLHYPDLPIPNNRELIYVDWDIDPASAQKIDKNRFAWISTLAPRPWMPVPVLPRETVLKHVIFEERWEDPVLQEHIDVTFECLTSLKRSWDAITMWNVHLSPPAWGELVNRGTPLSYRPSDETPEKELLTPPNLHKYTGGKEPIPKEGFAASTSFLDYPKQ